MPDRPTSPLQSDPFPPLPLLRRTYASVAAHSARSQPPPMDPPRNGWGAEDVDPSDRLDELNPYASSAPASDPPWRRQEGVQNGSSRRIPMFTLDELLGSAIPSASAPAQGLPATWPAEANRTNVNPFSLPGYQDVWPSRERQGSWDGGIEAARRRGYVPDPGRVVENDSTRRRNRIPSSRGNPVQMTFDPEEVLPFPTDDDFDGHGEDSHPWVVRSGRARLYQHENMTGDNLDGWGRPEGVGAGSLSRGRNNRRRRSLIERRETQEEDTAGLDPTNVDVSRGSEPLVVRSSGVRRQREDTEDEVIEGLAIKLRKKRKLEDEHKAVEPVDFVRPAYLSYSSLDPSTPLPDRFLPPTRSSRLALTTLHSPDRPSRSLITFTTYPPPQRADTDAASLRTLTPIAKGCGIHYYEAEVLDQGQDGFMSIGWMMAGVELGRLVGWDKGSWGWHGDDGMSFEEKGAGEDFSEKWGSKSWSDSTELIRVAGDTVGAGIEFATGRAFFTKNGKFVGHRFKNLSSGLHPAIGLRTPRESIAVNFSGPFVFDIDGYVQNLRDQAWMEATKPREVLHVSRLCDQKTAASGSRAGSLKAVEVEEDENVLPSKDESLDSLPQLSPLREASNKATAAFVLDYLAYNGYDTALRLTRDAMAKRQWLSPTSSSASHSSRLQSVLPESPMLEDFPSIAAALIYLHTRIFSAHTQRIPWPLIASLNPGYHASDSIYLRMRIHEFLRLLRIAEDLSEPDVEVLQEAIDLGKTLLGRSKEEGWSKEDRGLLDQAFGLLGIPVGKWNIGPGSVAGEERRRRDADELVESIRRARGMKDLSFLEHGMRQSVLVGRRVAEVDGRAGLVDVRRIWERGGIAKAEQEERDVGLG